MAYDFDLFTIGAGSGGVAGSRRAGAYGARVGIAEDVRVGGTCVLRGCVPKKLLVYGAHFADDLADAAGYGWSITGASHDWGALIAAKDRELDRLHGIYLKLLSNSGVQLFESRARLVDRHTIAFADGRQVTAERIMIATGGHPVRPAIPGIELSINSDQALDLPARPDRVVIWGGGYIAVEFAGIFRGFGAEVDLVFRAPKILRGFDEDIRDSLTEELVTRGIRLHAGRALVGIERTGDGLRATLDDGTSLVGDQVMAATGRAPNTAGLGLESVGISLGARGEIPVDDWSETAVPGIHAVGDVTDRINLTPVAIAEARAVAETCFNDNPTRFDHSLVASAVFSNPPAASIGLSEAAARARGGAVDIYRTRFRPMKHTLSGRQERTMMKLVVDRASDLVLGCHMVGADAPELIQGLAVALTCGATKRQFDRTVGIHPTAGEEFVTLRDRLPDPAPVAG